MSTAALGIGVLPLLVGSTTTATSLSLVAESASLSPPCTSDIDCSLNGVCDHTTQLCVCDQPWSGAACNQLVRGAAPTPGGIYGVGFLTQLHVLFCSCSILCLFALTMGAIPVQRVNTDLKVKPNVTSWGGNIVQDDDGLWHL